MLTSEAKHACQDLPPDTGRQPTCNIDSAIHLGCTRISARSGHASACSPGVGGNIVCQHAALRIGILPVGCRCISTSHKDGGIVGCHCKPCAWGG